MFVLYQVPLFNQYWWLLLSISYFISFLDLIIRDIPTRCNIAFNTNVVIIYSNVEFYKYKPVSFLQLVHLIAMKSNVSVSPIKRNSKITNTFNYEGIIPAFVFIIFALYYIMARKGNYSFVSFINVSQYKSL